MKPYGIIYKATNTLNQKVYIGLTTLCLEKRRTQHIKYSYNKNYRFANALRKYGSDAFCWELIYTAYSKHELDIKEMFFIKQFNSCNASKGYNMALGGSSPILSGKLNGMYGKTHTDSVRDILRKKLKGISWEQRFGEEKSKDVKRKLSAAHLGRKNSKETLDKMSKNSYWKDKGHLITGDKNPNFGNKWSQQQREMVSGTKNPMFGKGHLLSGSKNPMFGKKHKPEVVDNMRVKMTGRGNNNYRKISDNLLKRIIIAYKKCNNIAKVSRDFNEDRNKIRRELIFSGILKPKQNVRIKS